MAAVNETVENMKDCQNCKHFYECDNTGHYEECLAENQKDYEERKDDE